MNYGGWWQYIREDERRKKATIDRALLARVFRYARPYLLGIVMVLLAITLRSLITLLPPLVIRQLIDVTLPEGNAWQLNLLALALFAVPLLDGVLGVVQRHYNAQAGEGIIYDLRRETYAHLQRMSLRFFTSVKSGEIVSRFNSDVVGAQNAITGTIPNITTNLVTLISTLAIMLTIEWRLTLLAIAVLPLFLLPARRVAALLRKYRRQAMESNAEMSSQVTETLSVNGAILVKSFARETSELARYDGLAREIRDIGVKQAQVGYIFWLGLGMAGAIGTAAIYLAGGHMALSGAISIGTIVAFAAYLSRLYGPLTSLSTVQTEFASAMVSFERMFEFLDLPVEIAQPASPVALPAVAGHIRFEEVSFAYGEPLVLEKGVVADEANEAGLLPRQDGTQLTGISFAMAPGELVALVGPSGAGKTTITYLLPRFYDPTAGRITRDGVDLRAIDLQMLERQIGMVTQETYLFHDTVRANLLYARPAATQAEVEAACRAANIHDVIARLPKGYDTVVGERGFRLSGGEKQRIAIARVILKDPRILVLDEATAHLDTQSEALVQAALEPLFRGRTSLVIAHRLSTVLAADKILVIERGRIVEQGRHEELLAHGGLYASLYNTQFGGEEIGDGRLEIE